MGKVDLTFHKYVLLDGIEDYATPEGHVMRNVSIGPGDEQVIVDSQVVLIHPSAPHLYTAPLVGTS